MPESEEFKYFDFHIHPSLKGSLTLPPRLNPWNHLYLNRKKIRWLIIAFNLFYNLILLFINCLRNWQCVLQYLSGRNSSIYYNCNWKWIGKFKWEIRPGWVYKFRQIFESQANLTQLEQSPGFAVVSFIALEKAFAQSKIIHDGVSQFAPLDLETFDRVINGSITYFQMFERDFNHLYLRSTNHQQVINIISGMSQYDPGKLNIVLSVEGSHSFKGDTPDSILSNLEHYKNKYPKIRFHHLTLTHLTRQPACVHCLGTRVKLAFCDLVPNRDFRPDPNGFGITKLGIKIICLAYNSHPYRLLIDIKHMSYVSRQQFYEMRRLNENWSEIPLIVSHAAVTGCALKDARIRKIKKSKNPTVDCDEVFWRPVKTASNTCFNPWTINLFDEDIEEVLLSKGLIGIILEERVLGFGKMIGEFMSPLEVDALQLKKPNQGDRTHILRDFDDDFKCKPFPIPPYESSTPKPAHIAPKGNVQLTGDMIFDLDRKNRQTHLDYLSCNIIHVLEIGFRMADAGRVTEADVLRSVCIGSDLDGIMDPINFPLKWEGGNNNEKWFTSDKYSQLKILLTKSMAKCLKNNKFMNGRINNLSNLMHRIFHTNGPDFLDIHFK